MMWPFIPSIPLLSIAHAEAPLFSSGLHALTAEEIGNVPLRSEQCGQCHTEIWQQWRESAHADAWQSPVFQASWQPWPNGWCLNCHVPLATAQAEITGGEPSLAGSMLYNHTLPPPGSLSREGIGCVSCHVRDGTVLTPTPPDFETTLAHEAAWEPRLSSASFCAGCHEFPFQNHTPAGPFSYGDAPLQATVSEWEQSEAAANGTQCQDCHMPAGAHTWPGAHNLNLLQNTLSVSVRPLNDTIHVEVTATNAAHRVPTGDPFHRLVVELFEDVSGETQVGRIVLNRTFERTETSWRQIADTTIPPATDGSSASRAFTIPMTEAVKSVRLWYYFSDPILHSELSESDIRMLIFEEIF